MLREHSGTFWNILEHSGTFWNILEHSGTFCMHSGTFWNILEHSETFWNILDVVEGCRKVDFQVDDTWTYRQTYIRTCCAASLLLKIRLFWGKPCNSLKRASYQLKGIYTYIFFLSGM